MDFYYLSIIVALFLSLFYLVFNYKIVRIVDSKFKNLYDDRVKNDMRDFYLEMESYSSLLENKINQFKNLLKAQEENLKQWEDIGAALKKTKNGKEISRLIEKSFEKENDIMRAISSLKNEIHAQKSSLSSKEMRLPSSSVKLKSQIKADEDTSIAEEILNDMYNERYDTVSSRKQDLNAPENQSQILKNKNNSEEINTSASFFSGLGKMLKPIFFTEEKSEETDSFAISQERVSKEDFTSMLAKKIPSAKIQPASKLVEESVNAPKERALEPQPNTPVSEKINPDELMLLLKKLIDIKERPIALQALYDKGFNQSFISDASGIPYSDLEATKNIYGLKE